MFINKIFKDMKFSSRLANNQGQVFMLMMIVFAIALVFFAITLNWGKSSDIKTQTMVGANTAVAATASIFASDAQHKWQTSLNGSTVNGMPGFCKKSSIWKAIITLIILIIVLIVVALLQQYYLIPYIIFAIFLAEVNLILQLTVVEPGLTRLWNRLQANLPTESFYLERGITTGLSTILTDQVDVPDYFDMDTDGEFSGSGSNDKTSRYGFFYTERLKRLQPPRLTGLELFLAQANVLVNGEPSRRTANGNEVDCSIPANSQLPCCQRDATGNKPRGCTWFLSDPCTDKSDARCNECCVPLYSNESIVNPYLNKRPCPPYQDCNTPRVYQRIRPMHCDPKSAKEYVTAMNGPYVNPLITNPLLNNLDNNAPNECKLTQNNPYAEYKFNYVFQPNFQNYSSTADSFLKFMGQDAINNGRGNIYGNPPVGVSGAYELNVDPKKNIMVGTLMPFLWNMADKVQPPAGDPSRTLTANITQTDALLAMTSSKNQKSVFEAAESVCPNKVEEINKGEWWKRTIDGLCSTNWPYDQCPKYENGTCPVNQDCTLMCTSAKASVWHDDSLDIMTSEINDFVTLINGFTNVSAQQLRDNFFSFYSQIAAYIAPACQTSCGGPNSNKIACDPDVCYKDQSKQDGMMRQWREILGGSNGREGIYGEINHWLTTEQKSPGSVSALCMPNSPLLMSPAEKSLYNNDFRNIPQKVAQCLSFHKDADIKYAACLDGCSLSTCRDLPRSLTGASLIPTHITDDPTVGDCAEGSDFRAKVEEARTVFLLHKDKINKRADLVKKLVDDALSAQKHFKNAYDAFNAFLGSSPMCDSFSVEADRACSLAPAYQLMKMRHEYLPSTGEFDNFIIYAWKSAKGVKRYENGKLINENDANKKRYWHIARVEMKIPTRCPSATNNAYDEALCGEATRLPWIRTYKRGFLGTKRCYVLADYNGKVLSRVTRWDEDRVAGNAVKFMNNLPLWQFTFSRGQSSRGMPTIQELEDKCEVNNLASPPIGVLPSTWNALKGYMGISDEQIRALKGAFMINVRRNISSNNRERRCLDVVDKFLSQGVSTQSCMRYYFDQGANRFNMKYENCPNAFKPDQTDHLPDN